MATESLTWRLWTWHCSVPEQETFGTWQSPSNQTLTRSELGNSLQGHLESQSAVVVSLRCVGEKEDLVQSVCVCGGLQGTN